jgi:hypothetical protein
MRNSPVQQIVADYHTAWVAGDAAKISGLLSPDVVVEVPVNAYPTREAFVAAVIAFSSMATRVTMLDSFANESTALQLYDMEVKGLGLLRVAEHFTVEGGAITRIRHIHDTHAVRLAGFVQA